MVLELRVGCFDVVLLFGSINFIGVFKDVVFIPLKVFFQGYEL